jgi:hypothetical protein
MSTVWRTKHRLLVEQCAGLVEWLDDEIPPEPAMLEEHAARLLLLVVRLLGQHQVDNRGRCAFCGWTRRVWRWWRPRPRCTVFRAADHAMGQGMDVVWWHLLGSIGRQAGLDEVRGSWVKTCDQRDHGRGRTRSHLSGSARSASRGGSSGRPRRHS